jgi:hypothetical protein
MAPRLLAAIAIICLPLAKNLDITKILSIIMALFVFIVLWETITGLRRGSKFWENWVDTNPPPEGLTSRVTSRTISKEEKAQTRNEQTNDNAPEFVEA